ncbi:hypothetical protein KM043_015891 [Ampulex compressa]|nr:hypothetical protein KM043_015891 [Ampulex compressa]
MTGIGYGPQAHQPRSRQGDKRGTTNCRYRSGAILHEHLSPEEVSGCASGRKVERRDQGRRSWLPPRNSLSLQRAGLVSKRYISGLASQWRIVCIEATIGERGATLINEAINNGNVSTENSAG